MKVVSERAGYRIRACAKHAPDVRFGSKADIDHYSRDVCFVPKADITRSFRKAKNGEMVRAHRWSEPLRPQVSTEVELEQLDSVRAPDAGSIGVRKLSLVKPSGGGCHLLVGVVHRKHNPGRTHLSQRTVKRRVVKLAQCLLCAKSRHSAAQQNARRAPGKLGGLHTVLGVPLSCGGDLSEFDDRRNLCLSSRLPARRCKPN